jgi:hypothetical protein
MTGYSGGMRQNGAEHQGGFGSHRHRVASGPRPGVAIGAAENRVICILILSSFYNLLFNAEGL